jgi:hypothetical protein
MHRWQGSDLVHRSQNQYWSDGGEHRPLEALPGGRIPRVCRAGGEVLLRYGDDGIGDNVQPDAQFMLVAQAFAMIGTIKPVSRAPG